MPALLSLSRHLTLHVIAAGAAFALAGGLSHAHASEADVQAAIEKANLYIELAKSTERAIDSWDRYSSWVNMKTGPTGKERYISYGLYEVYDIEGMMKETREAASRPPAAEKLDAAMARYLTAYEALAPVMNEAAGYYDREVYVADKVARGRELHKQLVPLATAFIGEREQLMPELRAFVRQVSEQETNAAVAKEPGSLTARTAALMLALHKVMDTFPRDKPKPMHTDEMERRMMELGPDTPGEKWDELIMGTTPVQNATIDVKRYSAAVADYAKTVEAFEAYTGEKPEDFDDFKPIPGQMLLLLRSLEEPLIQSEGREFDGAGQRVMKIVETYFEMMNESQAAYRSQLRHLP